MGRYNAVVAEVIAKLRIDQHDLHAVLAQGNLDALIGPDGVHPTEAGRELLASRPRTPRRQR